MKKWKDILTEMIFLFREVNEDTCTKINPYEEEHDKALKEFTEKYGFFGEKLMTEEEKLEKKKTGRARWYMLGDVPEYKKISELYHTEYRKIVEYRHECSDKGMDIFKEWFWHLWD